MTFRVSLLLIFIFSLRIFFLVYIYILRNGIKKMFEALQQNPLSVGLPRKFVIIAILFAVCNRYVIDTEEQQRSVMEFLEENDEDIEIYQKLCEVVEKEQIIPLLIYSDSSSVFSMKSIRFAFHDPSGQSFFCVGKRKMIVEIGEGEGEFFGFEVFFFLYSFFFK
jgi:hypothetical protein